MVQIWAYDESKFSISESIKNIEQKNEEIKLAVNINPVLMYKDKIDAVGCRMRITYSYEGEEIFHYSSVLTVGLEGWQEFLTNNPSDAEKIAFAKEAWIEAIGFVRGVIYAKSQAQEQSLIAQHLLPPIEMEKFLGVVVIEKVA